DGVTDRYDSAGVLVPDSVREVDPALVGPLALDDVQVGPAHAGGVDVDQDVERRLEAGFVDVVDRRRLAVLVDAYGLHGTPPARNGSLDSACAAARVRATRLAN